MSESTQTPTPDTTDKTPDTASKTPDKTPDQRRALAAWEAVKPIKSKSAKDFSTLCKQTTALILNSGLLPTIAYMNAKAKEPQNGREGQETQEGQKGPAAQMKACRDALVSYLFKSFEMKEQAKKTQHDLLMEFLMKDAATLCRAQSEALAFLLWLARFAQSKDIEESGKEPPAKTDGKDEDNSVENGAAEEAAP